MKEETNLRCGKCVWQHRGNDYLCDFATLAAPMTRGRRGVKNMPVACF